MTAPRASATDNLRGAALMCVSMAAFTVNDALMKMLSGEMPLFQAVFLRGVFCTVALVAMARVLGGLRLRLPARERKLVALRAVSEVLGAYFLLTALFNMPLGNVAAILQALPLTVTLAGAVFLGEPVGWRRMTAILVGFAGVMLIVRPAGDGFNIYSVYALLAVVAVTGRDLVTRRMSPQTPSMTVSVASSLAVTLCFGAATAVSAGADWVPLTLPAVATLLGAAGAVVFAYLSSVGAMRRGDIAIVSPYRYTGLIWALVLGLLIFGEWPTLTMLLGAFVVVATGVYTFNRERLLARDAPRAAGHALEQRAAVDTRTDSH